jgi:hypothetical protein
VRVGTHATKGSPVLIEYEEDLIQAVFDPAEFAEALFALLEEQLDGKEPPAGTRWVGPCHVGASQPLDGDSTTGNVPGKDAVSVPGRDGVTKEKSVVAENQTR